MSGPVNTTDAGWTLVRQLLDSAKNQVQVLPVDTARSHRALVELQVAGTSPMGAVVLNTGGILVDHGWIRILGSGSTRLNRELMQWNRKLYTSQNPGFLIVADDVIGGFFILNKGGLGEDIGKVYYLSPGNLEFEPLAKGYTEFLSFCFNGDIAGFYEGYRWKNWEKDAGNLPGDMIYNFSPMLFTKEAKDIGKVNRASIAIEEQYFLHLDMRRQLGLDKPDTIGHE